MEKSESVAKNEFTERFISVINLLGLRNTDIVNNIEIIDKTLISHIRNGRQGASMEVVSAFCSYYHEANPDYILTGRGEPLKKTADTDPIISNSSESKSLTQEAVPFEYDYTVMDLFKDYYSYLNYREIEEDLLKKQLTTLTDEESAKIAGMMGLDYEDFTHGIDIVTNSPHTGKLVPVYNTKAAAGKANIDMYGPRSSWINVGDLLKDSEASLYVYGNSMIPGYPPGSLIGIRLLNESFIEPGSVYVVQTESNRYIKRLYYNKDKTALVCMSDNHIKHTDGPMEGEYFYPPFEIPIPSVKIIYKVIGVIKRNSISLA